MPPGAPFRIRLSMLSIILAEMILPAQYLQSLNIEEVLFKKPRLDLASVFNFKRIH